METLRNAENLSSLSAIRLFLRIIPAVSTLHISTMVFNAKHRRYHGVPGLSSTIEQASPTSLFKMEDFPTFGRPIIDSLIGGFSALISFIFVEFAKTSVATSVMHLLLYCVHAHKRYFRHTGFSQVLQ